MRKYKYELPSMAEQIIVSHNLFLTAKQRNQISNLAIKVIGVNTVTKSVSKELCTNEIFCEYEIISRKSNPAVIPTECGYTIFLTESQKLKDIKNEGSEFLTFVDYYIMNINKKSYPVIHQVVISDIKVLEDSLYYCELPHR